MKAQRKIAFCQVSNQLINPAADPYGELIYQKIEGYKKPVDFWEIPLWIAKASASMNGELYIIKDVEQAIYDLRSFDVVMFSVLEANKEIIKQIIDAVPVQITKILGGYIDPSYFPDNLWFHTMESAVNYLGYEYKDATNYELFKGASTIPRLSLSDGCLYHCAFCCVENTIKEYSMDNIINQVESFRPLDFELVYLNDKTFGQSQNYKLLPHIFKHLKQVNKKFKGFIIQTTAGDFLKLDEDIVKCIRFVEIGVESFNDFILSTMHKPHREKQIKGACWKVFELQSKGIDIKLIPNILVSLPNENADTYFNTVAFVLDNLPVISHINIYSLALYNNSELSNNLEHTEEDKNENNINKSWSNNELDWKFEKGIKRIITNKLREV